MLKGLHPKPMLPIIFLHSLTCWAPGWPHPPSWHQQARFHWSPRLWFQWNLHNRSVACKPNQKIWIMVAHGVRRSQTIHNKSSTSSKKDPTNCSSQVETHYLNNSSKHHAGHMWLVGVRLRSTSNTNTQRSVPSPINRPTAKSSLKAKPTKKGYEP